MPVQELTLEPLIGRNGEIEAYEVIDEYTGDEILSFDLGSLEGGELEAIESFIYGATWPSVESLSDRGYETAANIVERIDLYQVGDYYLAERMGAETKSRWFGKPEPELSSYWGEGRDTPQLRRKQYAKWEKDSAAWRKANERPCANPDHAKMVEADGWDEPDRLYLPEELLNGYCFSCNCGNITYDHEGERRSQCSTGLPRSEEFAPYCSAACDAEDRQRIADRDYRPTHPHWNDCGCPEEDLTVSGNMSNCYRFTCKTHGPLDTMCATQTRELLTMQPYDETVAGMRKLNGKKTLRRTPSRGYFWGQTYDYSAESYGVENFAAYDDAVSDRQRYRIEKLGGRVGKDMTRSEASDYIKKLMGRPYGTWRETETALAADTYGKGSALMASLPYLVGAGIVVWLTRKALD